MVSLITGYAQDGLSDLIQRAQDDPDDDDGLGGVLGRWLSNQGPFLRGGVGVAAAAGVPGQPSGLAVVSGVSVRVCAPASIPSRPGSGIGAVRPSSTRSILA